MLQLQVLPVPVKYYATLCSLLRPKLDFFKVVVAMIVTGIIIFIKYN